MQKPERSDVWRPEKGEIMKRKRRERNRTEEKEKEEKR